MAEEWGTRQELLHPRDRHGRFRASWKMSGAAVSRVLKILDSFNPKTFESDDAADGYVSQLARPKRVSYGGDSAIDALARNFTQVNANLRKGKAPPDAAVLEKAAIELPEPLILSRVVDPVAFGLTPETIDQVEEYTGKLVSDKGFSSTSVGTPLPHSGPKITMVIAAPAGTKALVPRRGHREVILTPEQPYRITKVQPDGQGGYYVMTIAEPKGGTGSKRTKKLGTAAPIPNAQEVAQAPAAPQTPATQAPNAPQGPAPGAIVAPVPQKKQGRPAGPPPAPRNDGHVAENLGGTGTPAATPVAPQVPEPKKRGGRAVPAPPPPTPEQAQAKAAIDAARKERQKAAGVSETPSPRPKRTAADRREAQLRTQAQDRAYVQKTRKEMRQEAELRLLKADAATQQAEKEKRAKAAADKAKAEAARVEADRAAEEKIKAEHAQIAASIGEAPLQSMLTRNLVNLTMDQVAKKKVSKKKAAELLRTSSLRDRNEETKRFFDKLADSLDPIKAKYPNPAGLTGRELQLDQTIRGAWLKHRNPNNGWAPIAGIRDELDAAGFSRAEQDVGLKQLARGSKTPYARIIPVANSKALNDKDRASALRMGGEDNHAITFLDMEAKGAGDSSSGSGKPLHSANPAPKKVATPVAPERRVLAAQIKPVDPRTIPAYEMMGGQTLSPEGQKALDSLGSAGHPDLEKLPVEQKIRKAVEILQGTGLNRVSVSMTNLRKMIGDQASRSEVDAALKRLEQQPDIDIHGQSYARHINTDQRIANAVRIGNQDKDLIGIIPPEERTRPEPTPVAPERKIPGMAVGKTNANRAEVGERILIRKNAQGEWVPSSTKTGATALTVKSKAAAKGRSRSRIQISGVDENGNEITVASVPSHQTFWLAKEAPKAPAPKTSSSRAPRAPGANAEVAKELAGFKSREEARKLLDAEKMTIAELRDFVNEHNIPIASKDTRSEILRKIVEALVGRRLDAESIMRSSRAGKSPTSRVGDSGGPIPEPQKETSGR